MSAEPFDSKYEIGCGTLLAIITICFTIIKIVSILKG